MPALTNVGDDGESLMELRIGESTVVVELGYRKCPLPEKVGVTGSDSSEDEEFCV